MPWLYSPVTGMVEHQNEAEYLADAAANVAGWSKLTKLPIPDGDTTAQAIAYVQAQQKAGKLSGAAPTTSNSTANANATNYVASAVPGGAAVVSTADFLGALTSRNLWIRVGKVAVGGTLLLIALAKLTGAGSAISKLPVPIPI